MDVYWKTKVVPKFRVLLLGGPKKAAAEVLVKSFDESKEEINKSFEENKEELKPKVIGIYEASSTEIKTLIKEPKVSGLKKHSAKVQKFLDELVTIEFPGSKAVSEATSKYGPALVPAPVIFIFEKVSTFIVTDETTTTTTTTREIEIPPPAEATTEAPPAPAAATTTTTETEVVVEAKEVVVEKATVVEPEKVEAPAKAPVEPTKETPVEATKETPVEAAKETPAKAPVEAAKPEESPKAK